MFTQLTFRTDRGSPKPDSHPMVCEDEATAEEAIKNQEGDNAVDFVPERFENTLHNGWKTSTTGLFLVNLVGHQTPAWYNKKTGEVYVNEKHL